MRSQCWGHSYGTMKAVSTTAALGSLLTQQPTAQLCMQCYGSAACFPPECCAFLLCDPSARSCCVLTQFTQLLFKVAVQSLFLLFENLRQVVAATRDAPWAGSSLQLPEHGYSWGQKHSGLVFLLKDHQWTHAQRREGSEKLSEPGRGDQCPSQQGRSLISFRSFRSVWAETMWLL